MKNKLESHHQKKLVQWLLDLKVEGLVCEFWATINENLLSSKQLKDILIEEEAKRMGKLNGVSDIIVVVMNKVLFLELKREPKVLKSGKLSYSNSKKSPDQIKFLKNVCKSNVCDGGFFYFIEDSKNFILSHL